MFRTGDDGRAAQETSFRAHIAMAKRFGKPLMIHDRDAHADVLRVLDEEGAPDVVVLHCFSGDAAFATECVRRGYVLSFAGTVTFKNAAALRDAARITPLDQLLVETDAPYLTPMPYRGRPNAPYLIPLTIRGLAEATGRDVDELCAGHLGHRRAGLRPLAMSGSPSLLGPADVRRFATELGIRPTKTLGQNFVHDPNTVRRIVATADLAPDDVVVEVGPGLGSLTLALLPAASARVRGRDRSGAGRCACRTTVADARTRPSPTG